MSKDNIIKVLGVVVKILPGTKFKVKLENGVIVDATLAGRMRKYNIRIVLGDKVDMEISPYDLTRGRISYRHK